MWNTKKIVVLKNIAVYDFDANRHRRSDRKIRLHTIKYYAVFMLFIKIHCTALKSLGCQKCPSDSQLTCVQPAVSVGLCGSARSWPSWASWAQLGWAGRLLNADLENISIGIAL